MTTTHINDLPQEILIHIFSFLTHNERIKQVTPVSIYWSSLCQDSTFTRELKFDGEDDIFVITYILYTSSDRVKSLEVTNRNDIDDILLEVIFSNHHLQNLVIENCFEKQISSSDNINVSRRLIRRVLKTCKELHSIRISNTLCSHRIFNDKRKPTFLKNLRVLDLGFNPQCLLQVLNPTFRSVFLHREIWLAQFTTGDLDVKALVEVCADKYEPTDIKQ